MKIEDIIIEIRKLPFEDLKELDEWISRWVMWIHRQRCEKPLRKFGDNTFNKEIIKVK